MLKIKYFQEFKGDFPFLVILADQESLERAYNFFQHKDEAFLNDVSVTEFSIIEPLTNDMLYLNGNECQEIAEHFKNLSISDKPSHAYFDTEALGDKIEIIISYQEYDDLF